MNSTILCIGQDVESIKSYILSFGTPPEFAVMSYAALTNWPSGILTPVDYGSGIEHAQGLLLQYPTAHLQLGLYMVMQFFFNTKIFVFLSISPQHIYICFLFSLSLS